MNRNLLKNILDEELLKLSYKLQPKTRKAGEIIYFKEIGNGMILSFGIEKSKLYFNKITGSFYLAASFTWSMYSPSFLPENAYVRVGHYLSLPEKQELTDKHFWYIQDTWWNSDDKVELLKFIKAIELAEKRFIKQGTFILPELLNPLKYEEYKVYISALNQILKHIKIAEINNYSSSEVEGIFADITKKILSERKDIRNNKAGIKFVSTDAYNCHYFSSLKNRHLIETISKVESYSLMSHPTPE